MILAAAVTIFIFILFVASFRNGQTATAKSQGLGSTKHFNEPGAAIAPKLGNETAKAELGRAAWKVLHTTFARFPDKPTQDESEALRSYIHLFQRLYPCGDCASHFGELLKKFPPQVSSRSAAAAWGCHVHNQVNKRLKKDMFDCANIGDFYDCGCAKDEKEEKDSKIKDKGKGKRNH
ncbi:hypothetical protein BT63DRAFT_380570 [Microthyrium microscopicum]|uniref:Sulfhydryl oxidase n=1 Tax=Microthyrium microscopicum TaxID=703497 RepID=A0A6A6TUX7_9PEZI|nr:hypothetical protein BT63DRAFT_380570 [Microthyrium microscopicum]